MSSLIFKSVKSFFLFGLLLILSQSKSFSQIALVKECDVTNGTGYLCNSDTKLFFAATDPDHGYEPWVSDGTPSGTHILKDINVGTGSGMLYGNNYYEKNSSIIYKNEFYFIADDGTHGLEIWKSDGTENGTVMLKDINQLGSVLGSNYNDLPYFAIANGILFFAATDKDHGCELWKTDGTPENTVMVKDIYNGSVDSEPFGLTTFKNEVYFRAWGEGTNRELWKSNGTDVGTVLVKDIRAGMYGSFTDAGGGSLDPHFTVGGDYLYFRAIADGSTNQRHLWRTDGTDAGTIQLENHLSSGFLYEEYNVAAGANGTFYFIAVSNSEVYLFKSNGTPSGTDSIATNNNLSAIGSLYSFNGSLVFDGYNNSGGGLCISNGTTDGTNIVKSFPGLGSSASASDFATDGTYLYMAVGEAVNATAMENRVGQSNGTTEGTVVFPHYGFAGMGFYPLNGNMYYTGYDTVLNSSYTKLGLYELTPVSVGIKDIVPDENISLYPNPANQFVSIHSNQINENAILKIFNLDGKEIFTTKISNTQSDISLNVSGWCNGIYFYEMLTDKNIVKGKLIVVH